MALPEPTRQFPLLIPRMRTMVAIVITGGIVIMLLAVVAWLFATVLTAHSADLMGVEPNSVFALARLLETGRIYSPPEVLPFIVLQYGPGHTLVSWLLAKVFAARDVADLYFVARMASCLGVSLTILGVTVTLSRHFAVAPAWALIAGLLAGVAVFPSAYVARPDGLYLAAIIWSWYFFLVFLADRKIWPLVFAILLMSINIFIKQTALGYLAPLVSYALFYYRRDLPHLIALGITLLVISSGLIVVFPDNFIDNMRIGVDNGVSFKSAVSATYAPLLDGHGLLLAVWGVAFIAGIWQRNLLLRATLVASLYALILGTITAGKIGSNTNYYNEFVALSLIAVGAWIASAQKTIIWGTVTQRAAAGILTVIFCLSLVQANVLPTLRRSGAEIAETSILQRLGAGFPRSQPILDLHGSVATAFPASVVAAPFDVIGFSHAAGAFDINLVVHAVANRQICYAFTRRDLLDAVTYRDSALYPTWGGGVLEALIPQFNVAAVEGDNILMHNPRCTE